MKDKIILIMLAVVMFSFGVMCFVTQHYIVAAFDFLAAGLDLHAALRRR